MKIKFAHIRQSYPRIVKDGESFKLVRELQPKGGKTIAYVVDEDYKVIGYATARCSRKDFYTKRTGREIAHDRLKDEKTFVEIPAMDETQFIEAAHAGMQ